MKKVKLVVIDEKDRVTPFYVDPEKAFIITAEQLYYGNKVFVSPINDSFDNLPPVVLSKDESWDGIKNWIDMCAESSTNVDNETLKRYALKVLNAFQEDYIYELMWVEDIPLAYHDNVYSKIKEIINEN